jgi:hypothetical protein
MLETGNPLLATRVAGEWVFWETGNVDLLSFMMAAPGMFRTAAFGGIAILIGALLAFWYLGRARGDGAGRAGAER